jgi:hypothetical protein
MLKTADQHATHHEMRRRWQQGVDALIRISHLQPQYFDAIERPLRRQAFVGEQVISMMRVCPCDTGRVKRSGSRFLFCFDK